MILDLSDLQKLSGYKRPTDIKAWLRKNGVEFMVQAGGNPVSTLEAVNRALQGTANTRNQPDWSPAPLIRKGKISQP